MPFIPDDVPPDPQSAPRPGTLDVVGLELGDAMAARAIWQEMTILAAELGFAP